jgi:CheY-like chemotaxis protein
VTEEGYSKRQKAEGKGQKVYYWYIVVSAVRSVLTFMATAIKVKLQPVLEQYGAVVTAVASAGEALEALALEKPDLLLSNIGMPEMDGYMLIRQIRAMPPELGGQIRAIALSAYASNSDSKQALLAGFQKHIAKPVEPAQLIAVVATLIGRNSDA